MGRHRAFDIDGERRGLRLAAMARLERMSLAIDHQRIDFDADKNSLAKLSETLAHIHDDYFRLRETISALPNRADLRDLEDRVGERIETLAGRFDRALEKRGL